MNGTDFSTAGVYPTGMNFGPPFATPSLYNNNNNINPVMQQPPAQWYPNNINPNQMYYYQQQMQQQALMQKLYANQATNTVAPWWVFAACAGLLLFLILWNSSTVIPEGKLAAPPTNFLSMIIYSLGLALFVLFLPTIWNKIFPPSNLMSNLGVGNQTHPNINQVPTPISKPMYNGPPAPSIPDL